MELITILGLKIYLYFLLIQFEDTRVSSELLKGEDIHNICTWFPFVYSYWVNSLLVKKVGLVIKA